MKKNKKILIVLLALLITSGTIGITLAFFTDTKEQKNVFVMGNIGISLSEPSFEKETSGTYLFKGVLPNQTIVKDPIIQVNEDSLDVYLRSEITYDGLTPEEVTELEEAILFEDNWNKGSDGFYYYNKSVSKGQSVPIFHSLTIPYTWDSSTLSKGFQLKVKAEAIQANYFTPETSVVDGQSVIYSWRNEDGTSVSMQE